MYSVTLVHPEATVTVPVVPAIAKCSLFENNPALTAAPYRVQSPVPLPLFQEFVCALKGKAVNITDANFRGLRRLCDEFGFSAFAATLSEFSDRKEDPQACGSPLAGVRSAHLGESFQFVANGILVESDIAEAAALFPAVREQLSVDGCGRKFVLNDSGIEAAGIRSLLSAESIAIVGSQLLQSNPSGNANLERQFLGAKAGVRKNLSDLANLSVEALDSLLLSESVSVEGEDALLRFILQLGPGYRDLLRHIEVGFLSECALSLWMNIWGFHQSHCGCALPKGLHIRRLPRSIRGSFRAFRASSQSSGGSVSKCCGGAAAMASVQKNFTADATATQTL
jgi:hypothetical protein